MKISRSKLDEYIIKSLNKCSDTQKLFDSVEEKYNIPVDITSDIVAGRKDISEANDFIVFALLDVLNNRQLGKYFTDDEIKELGNLRYETKEFSLPLVFNNITQIAPDQWIGKITAKELMDLKDAQVIRYNENTQRTLRRIVRGEDRYYRIYLNKKSISEIKQLMESGAYIPDDITLNMPVDTTEYTYTNGKLTINELDKLDILDGYHRYISISQIMSMGNDFDYPMELRIVSFPEEKAKQFIFQKDQKTQMRAVDSKSMNQYDPSNIVIERLNTDPMSNIQKMIGRNKANIDYGYLGSMIRFYYFKKKMSYTMKYILEVEKEIRDKFNVFTGGKPDYLDHIFTKREIGILIYCFKNRGDYIDAFNKLLESTSDIPISLFNVDPYGNVRVKLINTFEKILERDQLCITKIGKSYLFPKRNRK